VEIRCCCVCCRSLKTQVLSIEDWARWLFGRIVRNGVLELWRIALIYLLTKKNSKQSMEAAESKSNAVSKRLFLSGMRSSVHKLLWTVS
jgi:hypothetical protein